MNKIQVTLKHISWLKEVYAAGVVKVDHVPSVHANKQFLECLEHGLIRAEVRYTITDKGINALLESNVCF